jgi:hypothetical protein
MPKSIRSGRYEKGMTIGDIKSFLEDVATVVSDAEEPDKFVVQAVISIGGKLRELKVETP